MRKFFYSISVFLFLCVLSFAYYGTYRIAEGKRDPDGTQPLSQRAEEQEAQAVSSQDNEGYGTYYLKDTDGFVVVYRQDKKTVFEPTGIQTASLPEELAEEIQKGKFIKSEKELYSFLENYST